MPIPWKSSKKAHQIPVNQPSLHCLLLLVSGPKKTGHRFVVIGESQRQQLAGTWGRKGRTRHYWASLHTKISPYDSERINLCLALWPPTTEMQLPEVDQSWLEPELIREGILVPKPPHVYPSCSLKLPNTSLFALITSTLTQPTAIQLYILIIVKEGEIYSLHQMINQLVRYNPCYCNCSQIIMLYAL